jgi:hypothetical protein
MLNMDVDASNTVFPGYPMSLNQANLDSAWTRLRRITRSWSADFLAPAKFAKPGDGFAFIQTSTSRFSFCFWSSRWEDLF